MDKALDDEMEAFQKVKDDYIESLREMLEETEEIFKDLVVNVLTNADVIQDGIDDTAKEHNVTLSDYLTSPWVTAAQAAETFKTGLGITLSSLTNESGIVTVWSTDVGSALSKPFEDMLTEETGALDRFKTGVETAINTAKGYVVNGDKGYLGDNLDKPWLAASKDGDKKKSPISTFSIKAGKAISGVVNKAKEKIKASKDNLSKPWKDVAGKKGAINTFSENVKKALTDAVNDAKREAANIKKALDIKLPDIEQKIITTYITNGNPPGGGDGGDGSGPSESAVKLLQQALNKMLNKTLAIDGKMGSKTIAALKDAQRVAGVPQTGKYDETTRANIMSYLRETINTLDDANKAQANKKQRLTEAQSLFPASFYAKGTLGTKRDEWAITDESWIGEEITLAAGKNGQLQYFKKGSAVMPADISANLVEWGKLDPNMMNIGHGMANLNMINNAVSKPEFNMSFDSLVHVDHCDEGTLKDLEKMVDTKINQFTKQMNYALKGYSR